MIKIRKAWIANMFHSCPKNRLLGNNTVPLRKNAELKYINPTIRSMDTVSNDTPLDVISLGPLMNPTAIDTTLYLQTRRSIQMTNQFVDDISAHYSQGIHRYLPIIFRKRFHDYLIHVGASPSSKLLSSSAQYMPSDITSWDTTTKTATY